MSAFFTAKESNTGSLQVKKDKKKKNLEKTHASTMSSIYINDVDLGASYRQNSFSQHPYLWCNFNFTSGNVILQKSELHKIVHHLMNTTNITAVSMEIGMSALLTSCKNFHQCSRDCIDGYKIQQATENKAVKKCLTQHLFFFISKGKIKRVTLKKWNVIPKVSTYLFSLSMFLQAINQMLKTLSFSKSGETCPVFLIPHICSSTKSLTTL